MVNGVQEPPQLKIEIPANRYDLLCFEGISLMLNIFNGKVPPPEYKLVPPPDGKLQTLTISKETMKVRPLCAAAILRNVTFTKKSYESFIALQDKLHMNLARQRSLVSIGTHDLDTIQGPFTYEAHPPKDIKFVPLNQTREFDAEELMAFYEADKSHLAKYLPIIRDKPVYPVIYDAKRTVMSLPPIINGNHSKITLNTKNVFIEITATDETKLDIVCDIMATMFSMHCAKPFEIEPVQIISEHNGQTRVTPRLSHFKLDVDIGYLNDCTGLSEGVEGISKLLSRMAYKVRPSPALPNGVEVTVPPTRPDVLQRCDIMEDLAICYGFNRLPRMQPNKSATIGAPQPINKLADVVRLEAAMAGWSEVLPLILCSHDENFAWLNRPDPGGLAVKLENPKTAEYQIVRTSLLPGLLKTIRENKMHSVPIKVFEVSDVALQDPKVERKARNERRLAAAWYGKTSGFEVVHGLLDRVMLMLKIAWVGEVGQEAERFSRPGDVYWLEPIEEPTFFPGHAAAVILRRAGEKQGTRIGEFGILHPTVLEKFELK